MTSPSALQKLVTWLSPAFPVGSFAWSAGLETAIAERAVTDSTTLQNWIAGALAHGSPRTDAILLAEAWGIVHRDIQSSPPPLPASPARGEVPDSAFGEDVASNAIGTLPLAGRVGEGGATRSILQDLTDLSLALTSSRERWLETTITADSFARGLAAWRSPTPPPLPDPCPYPIAVGAFAAAHRIELPDTLLAWLTATVHGQISVAVRLVPLGQTDGLRVMAALEPAIAQLAADAASATLADIGAIAYAADIAQMRHETLEPRIFRS